MRGAGKYFVAEGLRHPKLRGQLPDRPAPGAVRPNRAVPGTVPAEVGDRTRRRLQACPQRNRFMRVIDGIEAELAGDVADAGVRLGQIDTALAGIGVDQLILRVKGPVARVEAKPVMPMIDGRVQKAAAFIDDGEGYPEPPGLVQRVLVA